MRWRVWLMNWSNEPIRMGSGSITTQAPHSHVAWIAVTSDRVVGPRMATWWPGPMPFACMPAARERASSCRSDHDMVTWSSPSMNVTVPFVRVAASVIRSQSVKDCETGRALVT